jgi:hypothetical protein
MFTSLQVATACLKAGFKVLEIEDVNDGEQTDGSVQLTPNTHIQVGEYYLCLVKETDGSFEWLHETQSLTNMIYFIRSQLILGKL